MLVALVAVQVTFQQWPMVINMVMALIVLPLLIWFVRPKFVARTDLLVTEEMDLSDYEPASQR